MAAKSLRWGVISTGRISSVFCAAAKLLPRDQHQVVAVAARFTKDAETFAEKFGIPKATTYEGLFADPDVDVVYIGAVNPVHARLSKQALRAGKHVLCEKPMCINAREAREVVDLAKEKGLFFMEGFWTRFFPAFDKLRDSLSRSVIGDVRVLHAQFGAVIQHKERVSQREMGGGGLLDLGCYCVQLAELVFGGKPEKIVATGTLQKSGVDDTVSLTLHYAGNKMAMLSSSSSCKMSNTAYVYGTGGTIEMPDLWCPTTVITPENAFSFPIKGELPGVDFYKGSGFAYQINHVREMIIKGGVESPLMTHASSISIMEILDEARRQLGVVFPPDQVPTGQQIHR